MAFSTTISALDLSGGLADVRLSTGYIWDEVGGPDPYPDEQHLAETTLDVTADQFLDQGSPVAFSYPGSLAPQPTPAMFIGMWAQEIPAMIANAGWLFRSGGFSADPPSLPLEVILAPEELIGNADLTGAVGALPVTFSKTTITAISLTVAGANIALVATGTDTRIPPGDTFSYTATLLLLPSSRVLAPDQPFEVHLKSPNLVFSSGTGHGFETFILNLIGGWIETSFALQLRLTLQSKINSAVLASVATRLNRGIPSTMPPTVVLSIRQVRNTSRKTPAGDEEVIGIRAALGAFGGVLNKFPVLASGGNKKCPVTAAAQSPDAAEVTTLRTFRDSWLRNHTGGPQLIAGYERLGEPLAQFIARSGRRRAATRILLINPAARLARRLTHGPVRR